MRACLTIIALSVIIWTPGVEAGWRVESSDTGPNALVIWNDYAPWKDNRTTYVNDASAVNLLVQAQVAGDYQWRFKPSLGNATNPALRLYETFVVLADGQVVADLAQPPHEAQQRIHFRALEVRNFTLQTRIRNLTTADYDDLARESAVYAAGENRALRPHEILAWLTLTQRDPPSSDGNGSGYEVRPEIDLALVYRIPVAPLEFRIDADRPALVYKRDPKGFPVTLSGATFELSGPAHARIKVDGALAGHVIEFLLDNETTPLWELPRNGYNAMTPAVWVPERDTLLVHLPAGTHRLLYRVHAASDPNIDGSVQVSQVGEQFRFLEALQGQSPGASYWPWILTVAVVLLAAWPVSRWTWHRGPGLVASTGPWIQSVRRRRRRQRSEASRESGSVIRL